jgi:hypothetical protein
MAHLGEHPALAAQLQAALMTQAKLAAAATHAPGSNGVTTGASAEAE